MLDKPLWMLYADVSSIHMKYIHHTDQITLSAVDVSCIYIHMKYITYRSPCLLWTYHVYIYPHEVYHIQITLSAGRICIYIHSHTDHPVCCGRIMYIYPHEVYPQITLSAADVSCIYTHMKYIHTDHPVCCGRIMYIYTHIYIPYRSPCLLRTYHVYIYPHEVYHIQITLSAADVHVYIPT